MLPVMMAAGHGQYGKATRYTLQQYLQLDGPTKDFFVIDKNHTVRYANHEWEHGLICLLSKPLCNELNLGVV